MKHTKGSWTVVPQLNTEKRQSSYADTDVAYFIETDAVTLESDVEANARLIAAAPEMLVMLELVREYLTPAGGIRHDVDQLLKRARGES